MLNVDTFQWNPPSRRIGLFELEDATLESLRLTREQGLDLVAHAAALGVRRVALGPASHPDALVLALECQELDLTPVLTAHADEDLAALKGLGARLGSSSEVRLRNPAGATLGRLRELGVRFRIEHHAAAQASPARLARLIRQAADQGACALDLVDGEGLAAPEGLSRQFSFLQELQSTLRTNLELGWMQKDLHGLGCWSSLTVLGAGATAIRATGLGWGGWTSLELLLANLSIDGEWSEARSLADYCRHLQDCLGVALPPTHPLAGPDAFRSVCSDGESCLCAEQFGFEPVCDLGPFSDRAQVRRWSRRHGLRLTPVQVERLHRETTEHYRCLPEDTLLATAQAPERPHRSAAQPAGR